MLNLFRQSFKKANIVESNCVLANPNRGMYQIFTVCLDEETDFERFRNCLIPTESLILLIVDIGAYKNKLLDEEAIEQIERVICFFSAQNKGIIFRPVYDHEGQGEEREPDSFEMVKAHMTTIADIVKQHAESIFILQGLLVGNWGEMHGSKYLGKGHLKELIDVLDERLAGKVYLSVRKPVFYRKIRAGYDVTDNQCRLGLFDDAILASETDFGTYGVCEATEWEKSWIKESELTFEETICLNAPNGGETVFGDDYTEKLSSREIISALSKMRLTYLNRLYDRKVLDRWSSMPSGGSGKWKLASLYNYIEAHLGYRYVIESVEDKKTGDTLGLDICISNNGFAPAYMGIELKLLAVTNGVEQGFLTGHLVSGIKPALKEKYKINIRLTNNIGAITKFYLCMVCVDNNADVLFANEGENNRVYLGELQDYTVGGVEK